MCAGFAWLASTVTVPFAKVVFAPRVSRIPRKVWTSEISGTLCKVEIPSTRRVAARIGRAAFFEPLTETSPFKTCPPSTINFDTNEY